MEGSPHRGMTRGEDTAQPYRSPVAAARRKGARRPTEKEEMTLIRRFLSALMMTALLCGGARAAQLPDLVRLQVVAESDDAQAQALKLELRDTCLRAAEVCLSDASDADEAYDRLCAHLDDFQAACADRARELGCDAEVRAEVGTFEFPDRVYGELFVPAGEYRALRITVGAGEGHNWWCVLYPSLCVLNEADAAGEPDASGILDWLRARLEPLRDSKSASQTADGQIEDWVAAPELGGDAA